MKLCFARQVANGLHYLRVGRVLRHGEPRSETNRQHRLDSAWEQDAKRLEARKMLDAKRAAREASRTSGAPP